MQPQSRDNDQSAAGSTDSKYAEIFSKLTKWVKTVGRFMVFFATCGLLYTFCFYFFVTLPMMNTKTWTYLFHLVMGIYLTVGICFYYMKTVWTHPGSPTEEWICTNQHLQDTVPEEENSVIPILEMSKFWCQSCGKPKPRRAHHCHICQRCILRMDHHCPWFNNCVGLQNYKYFLGFTFFMSLAANWNIFMILFGMVGIYDPEPTLYQEWKGWLIFDLFLCVAVGIPLTFFTLFHSYLIFTNQSTIEFQFGRLVHLVKKIETPYVNPYDMGIRANVQQIMGKSMILSDSWLELFAILLLLDPSPPESDGLTYPTNLS